MNHPIPAGFFDAAVTKMKALLDFSTTSKDALMEVCAEIAYTSCVGYCNRSFHTTTPEEITQDFFDVGNVLYIPRYPLADVSKVEYMYVTTDPDEMDADIWKSILSENMIVFAVDEMNFTNWLRITFTAGTDNIANIPALLNAVVEQGVVVYRKKDYLGIVKTTEVNPAGQDQANLELIPDVKNKLRNLIFEG